MNIKEKLVDAHNNFPVIDTHPKMLFGEALSKIIALEEALEECGEILSEQNWRGDLQDEIKCLLRK